jgi:hypothetical protein
METVRRGELFDGPICSVLQELYPAVSANVAWIKLSLCLVSGSLSPSTMVAKFLALTDDRAILIF